MLLGRVLKGGTCLSVGNGLSAIFSFLRNIIIARLVSIEDFGIVVLLSLVVSVIETISNLAIDRLLVQAPDGDDIDLQATAHLLQVIRGIVSGLLVLVSAAFLASFFKVPQAAWAFQMLSIVPIIRGFAHLDIIRFQREMVFQPTFWHILLPSALSFALATPLAYWFRDYSAIIWAMLLQAIAHTVISHTLATRPYSLAWDRAVAKRIMLFGWPLLANGLLMFVIFQGDNAVIAAAFTPEVVGWYGAAFMLSMAPAMLVTSVMQSLLLPLLSRLQGDLKQFRIRYLLITQVSLAVGFVIAVFFSVFGPELLILLFGVRYRQGAEVIILLGLTQGIRVAKAGQFVAAVAIASTTYPLYSNLARGVALFVAIGFVAIGYGPVTVSMIGLLGEFISYVIAMYLLSKRVRCSVAEHMLQNVIWLILVSLSWLGGLLFRQSTLPLWQILLGVAWLFTVTVIFCAASPGMRSGFKSLFNGGKVGSRK